MPIVALTREYGSGGTDISMKVAERLGYEYIRDQVTREAAELFGVAEDELIAVVEGKPGFWESLAEATRVEFALVASEVYHLAERDNVVIMGRWATLLLKEIQHCVRVRLCVPMEARIPRVMARRSVGREETIELIRKADEGASARIQHIVIRHNPSSIHECRQITFVLGPLESGIAHGSAFPMLSKSCHLDHQ